MNYTTDFKSIRGQVSPQEWQTRVDLAACYRLIDKYGMTDLICNHIDRAHARELRPCADRSLRHVVPEITASSLVKIDVEGEIIWKPDTDYGINKSGYVIHGAIHKARSDVACVLHTHTRAGIAVSAMKCGLLPLSQTSMRFVGHIGYPRIFAPPAKAGMARPGHAVSVPVLVELEQGKRAEHVRHRRRGGGM